MAGTGTALMSRGKVISVLNTGRDTGEASAVSDRFLHGVKLSKGLLLSNTRSLGDDSFSFHSFRGALLVSRSEVITSCSPLNANRGSRGAGRGSVLGLLLAKRSSSTIGNTGESLTSGILLGRGISTIRRIMEGFCPSSSNTRLRRLRELSSFGDRIAIQLNLTRTRLGDTFRSDNSLFRRGTQHVSRLRITRVGISRSGTLLDQFDVLNRGCRSSQRQLIKVRRTTALLSTSSAILYPAYNGGFSSSAYASSMSSVQGNISFRLSHVSGGVRRLSRTRNSLSTTVRQGASDTRSSGTTVTALRGRVTSRLRSSMRTIDSLGRLSSYVGRS